MQEKQPRTAEQIAEETLATLKSIERAGKQQALYTKICATGTILTAVLVVVCMVVGYFAYLKMAEAVAQAQQEMEQLSAQITEQISALNLDEMSDSVASMVENIDGLVNESRDGITAAGEAMEDIDIDGLNDAIEDLQNVIAPLADFFNMF